MITRALILCAGLGTRLQPLTSVRAKPAIPVAGTPMIRRIVSWLAGQGVDDLVVNLHHLPHTLTACLGDGRDLGARVRYSWEVPRILGSAGGPRLARAIAGGGTFLIVNGDTLTDVDLGQLADAHAGSGASVTLALVPNREFLRYGGVVVTEDGPATSRGAARVSGFVRRGPQAAGSYHFIGVQVVDSAVFDGIEPGAAASSIGGVYDALIAARPGSVRAVISDAAFYDVGTPADYWRTSRAVAAAEGTSFGGSILWDDVAVAAGAQLDECIVTDGVEVTAGASHRREILIRGGDGRTLVSPLTLEP
jgi:mannose-1-phosphate guanylyltransferase